MGANACNRGRTLPTIDSEADTAKDSSVADATSNDTNQADVVLADSSTDTAAVDVADSDATSDAAADADAMVLIL